MKSLEERVQLQPRGEWGAVIACLDSQGYQLALRALRVWYQYQQREFSDVSIERGMSLSDIQEGVRFLPESLFSHHVTRWLNPWDKMAANGTVGQVLGLDVWLAMVAGSHGVWECPICHDPLLRRPAQTIADHLGGLADGRILLAVPRMREDPPLMELASLFEATKVLADGKVLSVAAASSQEQVDGAVIIGVFSLPRSTVDLVAQLEAAGRRFGSIHVWLLSSGAASWLGIVGPSMVCFGCRSVWSPPTSRALVGHMSRNTIPGELLLGDTKVQKLWHAPVAQVVPFLIGLSRSGRSLTGQGTGFERLQDLLVRLPFASSMRWRELPIEYRVRTLLMTCVTQRVQQACIIIEGVEGRLLEQCLESDRALLERIGESNHLLFLDQHSASGSSGCGVSYPVVSSSREVVALAAEEQSGIVAEYCGSDREGRITAAELLQVQSEVRAGLWGLGQRCRVELVQLGEVCCAEGVPLLRRLGLVDVVAADIARLPEFRRGGYTTASIAAVLDAVLTGESPGGIVADLARSWLSEPLRELRPRMPSFAKINDFIEGCLALGMDTAILGGLDEDRSVSERLCLASIQVVVAPGPAILLLESARWLLEERKWQQLERFLVGAGNYKKRVVLLR